MLSIGVVVLLTLAGCSQTPPNAPEANATRTPATNSQKTAIPALRLPPTLAKNTPVTQLDVDGEDLSGLEIIFWHSWEGQLGELVQQLVEEFNQENEWAIQVRAEYKGNLDELDGKMRQQEAGEGKPQLVAAYLHQALNWSAELAQLDAYVDDPVWGLSAEQQADFYPSVWQAEVIRGERLGVPALRSGQFLYYNETWGRELGFDQAPQNWGLLEQQVCAAAKALLSDEGRENDGLGGLMVTTDYSASLSWMAANGAEVVDESGDYQFDTPQVENTFEALRKLSERGCARLVEAGSPVESFANREGLVTSGSLLEAPVVDQALRRVDNQDQWTLLPFLGSDGQAKITHYGPAYVILSSTVEEELAAWSFVRWFLAPERQARWIEASGGLPLQRSVGRQMDDYASRNPHWAKAVALLPESVAEPSLASWKTVRWAISDATVQLFRYYFSLDQVPDLVKLLDEAAQELNER